MGADRNNIHTQRNVHADVHLPFIDLPLKKCPNTKRKRGGVQKSMGHKVSWKIGLGC